jgi:hypothetical protein
MSGKTEPSKDVDIVIPSNVVSFNGLINRYDHLVEEVNSYVNFSTLQGTSDRDRLYKSLHALRLTCSVLLSLSPIRNLHSHRTTLDGTARRAFVLENVLQNGSYPPSTSNHVEAESSHIIAVEVVQPYTTTLDDTSDMIEWKYKALSEDTAGSNDFSDVESYDGTNVVNIPLSMTREELMEEESMLLQMANTPIPTASQSSQIKSQSSNNRNDSVSHTLRFALCQEWDETEYQRLNHKFNSGTTTNKSRK